MLSHLLDLDLGGSPATDVPTLAILALALLAAGVSRLSVRRRHL